MNVLHVFVSVLASLMANGPASGFVVPVRQSRTFPSDSAIPEELLQFGGYALQHQQPSVFTSTADDAFAHRDAVGRTFKHDNDRSIYDPGVGRPNNNDIAEVIDHTGKSNDDTDVGILNGGNTVDLLNELRSHLKEDEDIAAKSELLLKMLEQFDAGEPMPLVYVEGEPDEAPDPLQPYEDMADSPAKRSGRYNRRYPYKRQNMRYRTYESEQRYMCVPSRNDVLKLLIDLDEGRKGNHGRTVNFCNRKRPAKAIFSNIRFLG